MLAEQVAAASAFGFDHVMTYASKEGAYNAGYYVWPSDVAKLPALQQR